MDKIINFFDANYEIKLKPTGDKILILDLEEDGIDDRTDKTVGGLYTPESSDAEKDDPWGGIVLRRAPQVMEVKEKDSLSIQRGDAVLFPPEAGQPYNRYGEQETRIVSKSKIYAIVDCSRSELTLRKKIDN